MFTGHYFQLMKKALVSVLFQRGGSGLKSMRGCELRRALKFPSIQTMADEAAACKSTAVGTFTPPHGAYSHVQFNFALHFYPTPITSRLLSLYFLRHLPSVAVIILYGLFLKRNEMQLSWKGSPLNNNNKGAGKKANRTTNLYYVEIDICHWYLAEKIIAHWKTVSAKCFFSTLSAKNCFMKYLGYDFLFLRQ